MQSFRFANLRRLVVLVFLALAAGSAVASVLAAYAAVSEKASRELALRQGPPPAIEVDAYRPLLHGGPAGEIVLRAEADLDRPFVFTLPDTAERAVVIPLVAPEGDGTVHGAIFARIGGDALPPAEVLATRLPEGSVEVAGFAEDAGPFLFMLAGALAAEGRTLGPRFVAVRPFLEGREAALAPAGPPPRTWIWFAVASVTFLFVVAAAHFGACCVGTLKRLRGRAPLPEPVPTEHFPPLHLQEDDTPASAQAAMRVLSQARDAGATGWRFAFATAIVLARRAAWRIGGFRSPR